MVKKQLKREEVSSEYTWDLTLIFKSDEEFLSSLKEVELEVDEVCKYKGKISISALNLLEYLKYNEEYERKLYKLYYYAHLSYDQDTSNPKYQEYQGLVVNLITKYDSNSSFVNPELMATDYETILGYIKKEKRLEEYSFILENLYRFKKHILDEKTESIISKFNKVCNSSSDIYESLTDADLKFGTIVNEDGIEIQFTESNYSTFIRSKDRRVREDAFKILFTTYSNYKNTLAKTFTGNIETLTTLAKLKNHQSSIEASLFSDNVDLKVYNNFIEVINENLDVLYKYYDMKKEVLGLDEMHLYDIYIDLVKENKKTYSFEEGKKLVLESLSVLGEDYVKVLNKAFLEKWIDVYNNAGKRSGAYSSGFYDTKPYILLNYEEEFSDVSTLAHELGHSLHTYYSNKNQPYSTSKYKIFVAEVASTVNELLLNYYILNNTTDIEEKKFILNNLMELFKATIYRQIMFAEFERDCHKKHEEGIILTNEVLSTDYYELVKKYFGENVIIDEDIKYEWSRIPHFYYNFYVYKYAVGLSCACYIVNGILNKKKGALENYKKLLSAGGSDYPINILKNAGIDVTKKDFILSAIEMFGNTIEEFKTLIKK